MCLAMASENASSKIQQKLKKSRTFPMSDWSGDGWSCGWPVRVDSKRKQKWKKQIIKSWDYISLGKTQKREKPTSKKPDKHGKKLENKKTNTAAYVSADSVGHFFLLERKERVAVAVVGLESWCVSFLFCRLVRSIHPVDVWTKDESFFHPPSSTAGLINS
jgi:hypothetical protein